MFYTLFVVQIMEKFKNIEISEKNLFYTWVIVLSGIVLILGITYAIYGEFIYLKFSIPIRILIFLISSIQFIFLCFSKKLYEFNPNTKEYREGFKLFNYKHGNWIPFKADCAHFTFIRYEENVHYTYGGLTNKFISEEIFELRKTYKNQTFEVIISGSKLKSVVAMVTLGKMLNKIYGLPFYDYVRGFAQKEKNTSIK